MRQIELVTLNMRELDRLKVVQAIVEMGLKPGRAAERLGLSVRQVERLVNRYRASGAAGLCSGRRDRPGNRKLDEGLAVRALTIIRERYADFGPTLACEKLHECHGITLAKETVRHLMTRCRAVDSAPAAAAEDLPAAGAARVSGRAGADRRQRSPVVRGPGAGVHAAGVCGRRHQPADGAALHGHRVDLQLLRGDARVSGAATASRWRSTATGPACSIATGRQSALARA